ncbi:MAG: nitroreductase/quinone reductase family protein [Anaerolineales bacterium]
MAIRVIRQIFKIVNRFFMVPLFRLGLGFFVGNPITGYIMVLKTIGRKTSKQRYAPVNYAIMNGNVYCMAGFGKDTHWFRNLQSQPNIEVILPSGPAAGVAEDVTDSKEAVDILRQLLKNSGFAGFLAGFNPYTISDAKLREKTGDYPLVRIRPTGVGSGAADAGGWLWILSLAVTALALWLLLH